MALPMLDFMTPPISPVVSRHRLVATMAHYCRVMPVLNVVAFEDAANNRIVVKVMPDLRAPLAPRYCPEVTAIRWREFQRVQRRLDAVETRSTLITNQED